MISSILTSIVAAYISMAQPQAQTLSVDQTECLTQAIYFESRGEDVVGNEAVAYVVLNRSVLEHEDICEVIHERGQFSFYNPHKHLRVRELDAWRTSAHVAVEAQLGRITNPVGNATYYNTVPMHIKHTVYIGKIQSQYFYRPASNPVITAAWSPAGYADAPSSTRPAVKHHHRDHIEVHPHSHTPSHHHTTVRHCRVSHKHTRRT